MIMALDDNDLFIAQTNTGHTSVSVAQIKGTENMTLSNDDLFVVYRSTDVGNEHKKVTWETIQDELGPSGVIDSPVAIISPEDGAGMSNVSVTPAAEGITGVVEGTTTESFNYSDNTTYVNGSPYDDTKTPQYGWDGDTSSQMIIQPQVNTDPVSVTTHRAFYYR